MSANDRRERARALALEALRLVEEELAALTEEHPDRYEWEMAQEHLTDASIDLEPPGFPEPDSDTAN